MKKVLIGIGGVAIAGLLLWLTQLDGLEWLNDKLRRGPYIEARSASGLSATDLLADEKVTLVLQRANGQKVFWIFDEALVIQSGLTVQHAFPFEKASASGDFKDHTVHAIAVFQGRLATASHRLRVRNNRFVASSVFRADGLQLTAPATIGKEWSLVGAQLQYLDAGFYKSSLTLSKMDATTANVTFGARLEELRTAAPEIFSVKGEPVFVSYRFTRQPATAEGSGRYLELLQALQTVDQKHP